MDILQSLAQSKVFAFVVAVAVVAVFSCMFASGPTDRACAGEARARAHANGRNIRGTH